MADCKDREEMKFPLNMGSRKDFALVFHAYHQPLKRFMSKKNQLNDVEDMVENLFLNLWRKKQEFQSQDHLQAYLYRSAYYARVDHLRKTKLHKNEELTEAELEIEETESFLNDMIRSEVVAEVFRAINNLPSQISKVIKLSYIDRLSNNEIALEMGINEQSVKNHKYRGIKILRENLSNNAMLLLVLLMRQ